MSNYPLAMARLEKRLSHKVEIEVFNAAVAHQANAEPYMFAMSEDDLLITPKVLEHFGNEQRILDARAALLLRRSYNMAKLAALPKTASPEFWEICEALCGYTPMAHEENGIWVIQAGGKEIRIYRDRTSNTTMNEMETSFMRGLATQHARILKIKARMDARIKI